MARGARDIFGCFWSILAECLSSNKMLSLVTASPVPMPLGSVSFSSRCDTIEPSKPSHRIVGLINADRRSLKRRSLPPLSPNAPDEMRVSRKSHTCHFITGFNGCVCWISK